MTLPERSGKTPGDHRFFRAERNRAVTSPASEPPLLRQRLNRAFTQSVGIALALLRQLDDLSGDDLCAGSARSARRNARRVSSNAVVRTQISSGPNA